MESQSDKLKILEVSVISKPYVKNKQKLGQGKLTNTCPFFKSCPRVHVTIFQDQNLLNVSSTALQEECES